MVMPCSRSAERPSTSRAKSRFSPWVPIFFEFNGERRQLVLEGTFRFVEQAADQRASLPSSTLPQVMKRSSSLVRGP